MADSPLLKERTKLIYMLSGKFENCYGLKSFELEEINYTKKYLCS